MHIHGLTQKDTFTQVAINFDLLENFSCLLNSLRVFLITPNPDFNVIIVLHGQCKILEAIFNLPVLFKHLAEEFLGHLKLICTF